MGKSDYVGGRGESIFRCRARSRGVYSRDGIAGITLGQRVKRDAAHNGECADEVHHLAPHALQ